MRDLGKIRDETSRGRVREAIERVEAAGELLEVPNLAHMSGANGLYRIRVGDYRIGLAATGEEVEFVRCLHRRDIYRYFP